MIYPAPRKRCSSPSHNPLMIGAGYRKGDGRIHLAVKTDLMITYTKKGLKEVCATWGFQVEPSPWVGRLLEEWKISVEALDRITYLYLDPPSHRNVETRQRRHTRRGGNLEEFNAFRLLRLHRIYHKSS